MSTTKIELQIAPKSDDPVIVELGRCFVSKDGRHIYRQHKNFVLHVNIDVHGDDEHFLVNTLYDNHLTEYLQNEWLDELRPQAFQRLYNHVKTLMP